MTLALFLVHPLSAVSIEHDPFLMEAKVSSNTLSLGAGVKFLPSELEYCPAKNEIFNMTTDLKEDHFAYPSLLSMVHNLRAFLQGGRVTLLRGSPY